VPGVTSWSTVACKNRLLASVLKKLGIKFTLSPLDPDGFVKSVIRYFRMLN
jgi:hypothetical protein